MVRQHIEVAIQLVGKVRLDVARHHAVQHSAGRERQALVGNLLRNHVLKKVLQLGLSLLQSRQVEAAEGIEQRMNLLGLAERRVDRPEPAGAEGAANHAGHLQRYLLGLGEPVDPADDQGTQRVGQAHALQGHGVGGADALILNIVDHLVDVERVALRARGDALHEAGGQHAPCAKHVAELHADQPLGLTQAKLTQVQLAEVRQAGHAQAGLLALRGPVGQQQQNWPINDRARHQLQQIVGELVDPVAILDHQQERRRCDALAPALAAAAADRAHTGDHGCLKRVLAHAGVERARQVALGDL